jgi:lipopolysaccharide transport system ATP-binding protein
MNGKKHNLIIDLNGLSKIYNTYSSPRHRLLEIISGGRKRYSHETRALDDISFSLEKGGRLGIVGENGSGKSTLLKILAGVLTPTNGTVNVYGRVSALLELGAGFNPELSGQENVRQFCMLHGMHQDEIDAAQPEIIKFSELRDSVQHPVKTYSSGMAVRLGFACAVYVQPDLLIVDEALSVGDAFFQNKCLHKIRSMLDQGTSFIYVTHAADSIRSLCNEGIWLEKGKIKSAGAASAVGAAYQSATFNRLVRAGFKQDQTGPLKDMSEATITKRSPADIAKSKAFSERVAPLRTGSGEILIDDISIIDESGSDTDSVAIDEQIRIRVFYHVNSIPLEKAILNVGITDNSGRQILHFNPMFAGIFASDAPLHIPQMMEITFKNQLCPGEFGVEAGVATLFPSPQNNGQTLIDHVIDYCPGGARFSVRFPETPIERDLWGLVHVDYDVMACSVD